MKPLNQVLGAKRCYTLSMTNIQMKSNKGLIQAFKIFKKRYLSVGKKPNVKNLLPEDLYHTMRLEGEKISRKQVRTLYK